MRVLLWHGWLLDGTGSNVYTARVAEVLVEDGHDVVVLCQERHTERHAWVGAVGTVSAAGVGALDPEPASAGPGSGRGAILRPDIGRLLPVFVLDEYEGFDVKRFVDLTEDELGRYLDANVQALRAAVEWQSSDVVVVGHAVPGGVIGGRALGAGRYVVKIHGSDVEYAMRPQQRYRELAREGLETALVVTGSSQDVLDRCAELVPGIERRSRVVHPGVDAVRFSPRPRRSALLDVAARLDIDASTARGRPPSIDVKAEDAARSRNLTSLDALAHDYDQTVPDPTAAAALRVLARSDVSTVGYLGKLIPQKGVALLLAALTRTSTTPSALIIGFGTERERLQALARALRSGDDATLRWLLGSAGWDMPWADLGPLPLRSGVTFTGRLDHSYAPDALAAVDVLVVPSVLNEAFGMVAAEGAAAGALPLVARHSGLAEVAGALESHVGRPGLFSFQPGSGSVGRIAEGIDRLLMLEPSDRASLREGVREFVTRQWSWRRTAMGLIDAAGAR
ncbi:MAG TPA: glycosyltransferase [Actinomycetota bacterium]|jgi:glycosyltransferase involved in cell wall biosynthesis|nr:glycosyltransferase [Actinomycetota bacterium]